MSTLDRELDGLVPSLIKIDVEGAEHAVLTGALDTIAQHRPLVIFEHGHNDYTLDIFDMLISVGMTVFDIDGDGPYSRQRWLEAVERGDVWNFFAR